MSRKTDHLPIQSVIFSLSTSLQMIFTLLVAILLMTNKDSNAVCDSYFADVVLVMVNVFNVGTDVLNHCNASPK